jgi:hypothetical protein
MHACCISEQVAAGQFHTMALSGPTGKVYAFGRCGTCSVYSPMCMTRCALELRSECLIVGRTDE